MAHINKKDLQREIAEILKEADLTKTSAKKVRQTLEKKFNTNLLTRKEEIDKLVMDFINAKDDDESEEDDDDAAASDAAESEESEKEKPAPKKKRSAAPPAKASAKKKKDSSDEQAESGSDDAESDDRPPKKNISKRRPTSGQRKKDDSDGGSDEDWKRPKNAAAKKGGNKPRATGFTRACTLSTDLASIMGTESCPRHEVVKKIWAIIKERNLYDPKNKQFAICDSELHKIMGVKRFRTFGMMKYLKPHFKD